MGTGLVATICRLCCAARLPGTVLAASVGGVPGAGAAPGEQAGSIYPFAGVNQAGVTR